MEQQRKALVNGKLNVMEETLILFRLVLITTHNTIQSMELLLKNYKKFNKKQVHQYSDRICVLKFDKFHLLDRICVLKFDKFHLLFNKAQVGQYKDKIWVLKFDKFHLLKIAKKLTRNKLTNTRIGFVFLNLTNSISWLANTQMD
ncbi:hypothetical protein DEO72_LG8g1965 [Vigna unguiculata]|uniref:Uncharacterized protein n=1 Tax=Vigna unguiculata TaxID=3917 RepID=A0A4D6MR85_VIGUN|nr:hypothetical protein DEO72_LG8g1965 [Vigna unguiculata]